MLENLSVQEMESMLAIRERSLEIPAQFTVVRPIHKDVIRVSIHAAVRLKGAPAWEDMLMFEYHQEHRRWDFKMLVAESEDLIRTLRDAFDHGNQAKILKLRDFRMDEVVVQGGEREFEEMEWIAC